MNKPRFSSKKYSDSPYGDEEWERDFDRWENSLIEESEAAHEEELAREYEKEEKHEPTLLR